MPYLLPFDNENVSYVFDSSHFGDNERRMSAQTSKNKKMATLDF